MSNDETPNNPPSERSTRNWMEHTKNIIVAGLAGIPIAGFGTLASLLTEYLPDWKLQRIQTFLEELSGELEKLKREIDCAKMNTAEYGLRVEYVLRQVSQSYCTSRVAPERADRHPPVRFSSDHSRFPQEKAKGCPDPIAEQLRRCRKSGPRSDDGRPDRRRRRDCHTKLLSAPGRPTECPSIAA